MFQKRAKPSKLLASKSPLSPVEEVDRYFAGVPVESPQGARDQPGKGRSGVWLPQSNFFPARPQQEGPAGHCWALQLPWSGVSPVLRHRQFGSQPSVPEKERSCSLSQSYSPLNKALQEREGIISFLKGQLNPL